MADAAFLVGTELVKLLLQLKESRVNGKLVLKELEIFIIHLKFNLHLLRYKTQGTSTSLLAVDSLRKDLEIATAGFLKSYMNAKEVELKLKTTRESLMSSFQTMLQLMTLDVALNSENEFQSFSELLSQMHKRTLATMDTGFGMTDVSSNVDSLREAVTSMHIEVKDSIVDARSERQEITSPQTVEMEKFYAHVLANLEELERTTDATVTNTSPTVTNTRETTGTTSGVNQREGDLDDPWYEDPLTFIILCDPIKGSDGRTYDRWTIIDKKLSKSPYDPSCDLQILCDDVDVRRRLFRRFPEQESLFRSRRAKYRQEALEHANRREFGDALEKLNHVLEWNKHDSECARKRDQIQASGTPHDVLVAHWPFDGTFDDVSPFNRGPAVAMKTNVGLENDGGNDPGYVRIRQPGYLNVPQVEIHAQSFRVVFSLRVPMGNLTGRRFLYTDFSRGHWKFISTIDVARTITVELRRNIETAGSDPEQTLVSVTSSITIPLGVWFLVAWSFDRSSRFLTLSIDGEIVGRSMVRSSVVDVDLKRSPSTHYQFGRKNDEGNPGGLLDADLKNLFIFWSC